MKGVYGEIYRIAIPSIITNITTPLLSMLDVLIVGHLGDALYIAAIAVGGSMFNMIYWLFGFLRMGASGLTAQANGASDFREVSIVLWRGITVALLGAILLLLLQKAICTFGLSIMDVPTGASGYAARYFYILIWGAPAVLANYTFTGWFLGQKDARTPMWISFLINVSNIAVSLLLVYGFGLKIEGVAFGTLTAQWLGAIAGAVVIVFRYRPGRVSPAEVMKIEGLKSFFGININIFLRTLCLIGVTVWFTRAGASQGSVVLAVNLLLMQLFSLFSYFMDGFAFAGESLTGNYIGQKDGKGLDEGIKALLKIGMLTAVVFSILYIASGDLFIRFLTDDVTVRHASGEYLLWAAAVPACGFLAFTWDGIFIGATRTRSMLWSMAGATAVFFAVYYVSYPYLHNHGLWLAFVSYLGVRGLILSLLRKQIKI